MKDLKLNPIPRYNDLSPESFYNDFYCQNKPVIFRSFAKDWPALQKWDYEYFKTKKGDVIVPIQSEAFANTGRSYLEAGENMQFSAYLDLIATEPTKKRMFLFNIFKHMPELCEDFHYPDFGFPYVEKYPFMFFGGATSNVDVHYDLDLSHVFLTQFSGRKKIVMFPPNQSRKLYRHPLTVSCNIDIANPDFKRYPKLAETEGVEGIVEHGDTIFMPSGYWHYVEYMDGGFSLSLRARPQSRLRRAKGWANIAGLIIVDRSLSRVLGGERWYNIKEHMAVKRAKRA